jgi:hypothetical protein
VASLAAAPPWEVWRQRGGGSGSSGSGSLPAARQQQRRRAARQKRDSSGHGCGSRPYCLAATVRRRGGNEDTGSNSNGRGTENNQQSTKSSDGNGNGNGDNDSNNDDNGNKDYIWLRGGQRSSGGKNLPRAHGRFSKITCSPFHVEFTPFGQNSHLLFTLFAMIRKI